MSLFVVLEVFFCLFSIVKSKVIGAAILPHGDFAYDPSLVNYENGSAELHNASTEIGKWISDVMSPDIIFLSTPHGMALNIDFLIYENQNESGYAIVGGDLHNSSYPGYIVSLNISSHETLAKYIVNTLNNDNNQIYNLTGMLGFADSIPLGISWGEILPIEYLIPPLPKFVIFSHPLRRYNYSVEMIPELLTIGESIFKILDSINDKVLILISADLSHTHLSSGPYGYCNCSEPFDIACGDWVSYLDRNELLIKASYNQQIGAKSCGFTGFVLLQGMFDASYKLTNNYWDSLLLANYHPTYYGMMVANYTRYNYTN